MDEFTPEQTQRWEAWQRAGAVRARRTTRIGRIVGTAAFLALLVVLGIVMWRL